MLDRDLFGQALIVRGYCSSSACWASFWVPFPRPPPFPFGFFLLAGCAFGFDGAFCPRASLFCLELVASARLVLMTSSSLRYCKAVVTYLSNGRGFAPSAIDLPENRLWGGSSVKSSTEHFCGQRQFWQS